MSEVPPPRTGSTRLKALMAARRAAPWATRHASAPPPPAAKVAEVPVTMGTGAFHRAFTPKQRKVSAYDGGLEKGASQVVTEDNLIQAFALLRKRAQSPFAGCAEDARRSSTIFSSSEDTDASVSHSRTKLKRQSTITLVLEAARRAERTDRRRAQRRIKRSVSKAAEKLPQNITSIIGIGQVKNLITDRIATYAEMSEGMFRYSFRQRLLKGIAFTKHGRRGLPRKSILKVNTSSDLIWPSVRATRIPLGSIVDVVVGKNHVVFDRSGEDVPPEICFSLLTTHRSLDVEVDNEELRDELVYSFRRLLSIPDLTAALVAPAEPRDRQGSLESLGMGAGPVGTAQPPANGATHRTSLPMQQQHPHPSPPALSGEPMKRASAP